MRPHHPAIKGKANHRGLLALLFLVILLAEWGSHGVIHQSTYSQDRPAVSAVDQSDHNDPCRTLAVCSDGQRKDQQSPRFGQHLTQHNGLIDGLMAVGPNINVHDDPVFSFEIAHAIRRPPNPPFHPPELS